MTTLLDDLRANAATLADFDHAVDYIDHHGVAALLTRAAKAIEDAEAAREVMRRERNAAMNERDAAYAALRDLAGRCYECGEIATRVVDGYEGAEALRCDGCTASAASHAWCRDLQRADALRAAAKAGE